MEIDLPKRHDDAGPSSSLLLGGPGSDIGSGKPSSDQLAIREEARGEDSSAVDLGSPARIQFDEAGEAMTSDSAVAETPSAVSERPDKRVSKKGRASMGLLIAGGAGVLAASLLWIFGPLDGLRGSLRETVGLNTKKTQVASAQQQVPVRIPQAQAEDE